MKKKIALLLSFTLMIFPVAVQAQDTDISGMSLEELQEAYKELEAKYNELILEDDTNDAEQFSESPNTVVSGDLVFTLNGVTQSNIIEGQGWYQEPDEGKEFLIFEIEVENTGSEDTYIGYTFTYGYEDGQADAAESIYNTDPYRLEGELNAGEKRVGLAFFEVDPGWEEFEFIFDNSEAEASFVVTPDDVVKDYTADESNLFQYYEDKDIEVISADADILYQYADYFSGATVITAFKVDSKSSTALKTTTDSNDTFFFSIVCNFEDSNDIKDIQEDDIVAVIGTASNNSRTVTLSDSHIISSGNDAAELMDELAANSSEQIDYALEVKSQMEAAQLEQEAADRQAYIDECITVNYSDVERNPDNYKNTKVMVEGEVVQVSEGIFNSVTLRVKQSDGNIWYVTYTRDSGEARILEGDSVVIYGICKGVKSYTNLLGGQVTVPSVKAEYINQSNSF